jgi:hypothetical protein
MTNNEGTPAQPDLPQDSQAGFLRRLLAGFGSSPNQNTPAYIPPRPAAAVEIGEVAGASWREFPFEDLSDTAYDDMEWVGTLGQVLAAVEPQVANNTLVGGYWMSGRIVRGILDSRAQGPDKLRLATQATRLLLEQLAGIASPERFEELRRAIGEAGLRGHIVQQENDDYTWAASRARHALDAAARLEEHIEGQPALIIPLCHGGLLAGIQTALCYKRELTSSDTLLYPVRLSRRKQQDRTPHVTAAEMEWLRAEAKDRDVIIFDEDTATGESVARAVGTFAQRLPEAKRVIGIAGSDDRSEYTKRAQGEWWEKVVPSWFPPK